MFNLCKTVTNAFESRFEQNVANLQEKCLILSYFLTSLKCTASAIGLLIQNSVENGI